MRQHRRHAAVMTLLALGVALALAPVGSASTSVTTSAAQSPTSELLQRAGKWEFGRKGGAKLCDVQLTTTAGRHGYLLRACNPNESFWSLDGSTLVFRHSDGRVTTRFRRVNANLWEGRYLLGPGIVHYLRRLGGVDASGSILTRELLQQGGRWQFGRRNGPKLCDLVLTSERGAYGYVIRACNANESFWKLEGSKLVFRRSDGRVTTRFTRVTPTHWEGPYLGTPEIPAVGIVHYLRR